MLYSELTKEQKSIVDAIEKLYCNSGAMTRKDFVFSLAFLLNKHKKLYMNG